MAELLARPFDDVLTERMVSLSETFLTEQVAAYQSAHPGATGAQAMAAVGFVADRNILGGPSADVLKTLPWMVWNVEQIVDAQAGTGRDQRQETYTVVCDLYVAGAAVLDDPEDCTKVVARLSYLKEQAREILFRKVNYHLGFTVGTIARKRNYTFRMYGPPAEPIDEWLVGGRITMDLDASYTPEDVGGVPIEEIEVDTGKWSGLYQYED